MIEIRTALRTIAAQMLQLAHEQDRANHGPRLAGPAKVSARTDTIRRLRAWALEVTHAASGVTGEADPAIVGYLCTWVRGHYDSLTAACEYLRRREDSRWQRLRDADASNKAAVVLAALL